MWGRWRDWCGRTGGAEQGVEAGGLVIGDWGWWVAIGKA